MLRENSLQERSPLLVSCPNLGKQKASEEWNTTAYWGPIPLRGKHTAGWGGGGVGGAAGGSNSLLPAATASLPPAVCMREASLSQRHLGMDRQTHLNLTPQEAPPKEGPVLHTPGSSTPPCWTAPLGTGLAMSWHVPVGSGALGDYRAVAPSD